MTEQQVIEDKILFEQRWKNSLGGIDGWRFTLYKPTKTIRWSYSALFDAHENEYSTGGAIFSLNGFREFMRQFKKSGQATLGENINFVSLKKIDGKTSLASINGFGTGWSGPIDDIPEEVFITLQVENVNYNRENKAEEEIKLIILESLGQIISKETFIITEARGNHVFTFLIFEVQDAKVIVPLNETCKCFGGKSLMTKTRSNHNIQCWKNAISFCKDQSKKQYVIFPSLSLNSLGKASPKINQKVRYLRKNGFEILDGRRRTKGVKHGK